MSPRNPESPYQSDPFMGYGSGNYKPTAGMDSEPTVERRKKARRSCYGCQRAHRTCGDERPCQTCVKRGMAHACFDGARKIPKYLGDMPGVSIMEISASTSPDPQTGSDGNSPRCMMEGEYSVIDFNAVDSTGEPLQSSAKRRNSKKYPRKDEWAMGEAQEDLGLPKSDGSNIMSTSRHTDRIDGTLDPYIDDFCMYEDWPPASPAADENIGFTINSGWSSTFFPV